MSWRMFPIKLHSDRDEDIIERIESQPSHVGYVRELVRRDMHDERLDYAALRLSELQAESAKLREQLDYERQTSRSRLEGIDRLKTENARLRERLRMVWHAARLLQANGQIDGMRITDEFRAECESDFAELGVDA